MKKLSFALALGLLTVIYSCKKDETNPNPTPTGLPIVKVSDLVADSVISFTLTPGGQPQIVGTNQHTFYNLRTNTRVPASDSNSTNWDIAFRRTRIIFNGGNSGPGLGGAYMYNGLFNELKNVAVDSIRADSTRQLAISNRPGEGWYNYDGPNNLTTPIPGKVLVIRTADGKYAKLEILNYYKGGVTLPANASDTLKILNARHYTFRYSIQSNGSTSF
jgi:hypothetical protein